MKILITGATGLVGSALLEKLFLNSYQDIAILTRNKESAKKTIDFPVKVYEWDPDNSYIEQGALSQVDIVIHLAGANIAKGRWNEKRKKQILESRTKSTSLLLKSIEEENINVKKFISASAVGIYGAYKEDKDTIITTDTKLGNDFLADVCKAWEDELFNNNNPQMKCHALRTGVVLSEKDGALKKMLPAFKMGIAGKLGSGSQYMSWIHIDDLVAMYLFLVNNDLEQQVFNATSPHPVTNSEFTKTLASTLGRWSIFPAPAFALKFALGEMSTILLDGQRVIPDKIEAAGHKFKFPYLQTALKDLLSCEASGERKIIRYQWVNRPVDQVFHFFSDEKNLEKITPKFLNFKVVGKNTDILSSGTIIDYKLNVHGIPFKWQSRINEFVEGSHFIDEQLKGPYAKWVHHHSFNSIKEGTLLKDQVIYKVPFGPLGNLFAGPFVSKDIKNIFNYRNKVIREHFK